VLWIRAAIYLAAILPLSIAGLGVREGVLVVATAAYAVAPSAAVAWGLLLFSAKCPGRPRRRTDRGPDVVGLAARPAVAAGDSRPQTSPGRRN